MKKFLFVVAFALSSQFGYSQDKPTREEVIQVIEKSGASDQINAAKKQVLSMIPEEKRAAFVVEFDVIIKKANEAKVIKTHAFVNAFPVVRNLSLLFTS